MPDKAEIIYSGFYDVPLAFVVRDGRRQYLFWRDFEEALDDYPDAYLVFLLPGLPDEVIKSSWWGSKSLARAFLGEVAVGEVKFDPSRRKEIETGILERLAGVS